MTFRRPPQERPNFGDLFDDPADVLCCISIQIVEEFCREQEVPMLSKQELEELSRILCEDMAMDRFALLDEAISRLRQD